MNATALIAEDEALLAANLQAELGRLWPALNVIASVGDGAAAVSQALALRPDVMFLDIRMPGMNGLDAATALAEDWPDAAASAFPLLVFVTAYDQYALQAFDRAALDYVLKPVQPDRLAESCARLQATLLARRRAPTPLDALHSAIAKLQSVVQNTAAAEPALSTATAPPLRVIQAGTGNTLHMVPVDEVVYFEAADKYVRVITAEREHLIRVSLRELQPQLDASRFWQIHRGTIVRADAIDTATRDESGRLRLTLKGRPEVLQVSRMYANLFKAM